MPELGFELIPKNRFLITAPYTFVFAHLIIQSELLHAHYVPGAIPVLGIKRYISLVLYDTSHLPSNGSILWKKHKDNYNKCGKYNDWSVQKVSWKHKGGVYNRFGERKCQGTFLILGRPKMSLIYKPG